MTETAVPHDDCCIGFDGLEAMLTVAGVGHCDFQVDFSCCQLRQ